MYHPSIHKRVVTLVANTISIYGYGCTPNAAPRTRWAGWAEKGMETLQSLDCQGGASGELLSVLSGRCSLDLYASLGTGANVAERMVAGIYKDHVPCPAAHTVLPEEVLSSIASSNAKNWMSASGSEVLADCLGFGQSCSCDIPVPNDIWESRFVAMCLMLSHFPGGYMAVEGTDVLHAAIRYCGRPEEKAPVVQAFVADSADKLSEIMISSEKENSPAELIARYRLRTQF